MGLVIFLDRPLKLPACIILNSLEIRYVRKIRMNLLSVLYKAKGHKIQYKIEEGSEYFTNQ
jgi:hypothetical protein